MTQISKYPVHKKVEERMFEVLRETISHLNNAEDIEDFLTDFLSPVEKIMLAKRLSIAILLHKGYKYGTIAEILRVTPPTIATVSLLLRYSGKGYRKAVGKIAANEKMNLFWEKVEDMLSKIPNSKGSDWVYQKREYERKKSVRKKAF
ncbi:MAG: Trp family transcriptional regulator [Candidatus Levybacteria bacterium]|nr:Trp family transcriptional regulator [Candidatus Levybacteria bacterium]